MLFNWEYPSTTTVVAFQSSVMLILLYSKMTLCEADFSLLSADCWKDYTFWCLVRLAFLFYHVAIMKFLDHKWWRGWLPFSNMNDCTIIQRILIKKSWQYVQYRKAWVISACFWLALPCMTCSYRSPHVELW
jgi:hypothetical protein